jgi:Fe-S-cluster containining protein
VGREILKGEGMSSEEKTEVLKMHLGDCNRCGKCCKVLPDIKETTAFEKILSGMKNEPVEDIKKNVGRMSCPLLMKKYGIFFCTDYKTRPVECRAFPICSGEVMRGCTLKPVEVKNDGPVSPNNSKGPEESKTEESKTEESSS